MNTPETRLNKINLLVPIETDSIEYHRDFPEHRIKYFDFSYRPNDLRIAVSFTKNQTNLESGVDIKFGHFLLIKDSEVTAMMISLSRDDGYNIYIFGHQFESREEFEGVFAVTSYGIRTDHPFTLAQDKFKIEETGNTQGTEESLIAWFDYGMQLAQQMIEFGLANRPQAQT